MRHHANGPEIPRSGWDAWRNRFMADGRMLALEPLLMSGMARLHVVRDVRDFASTDVYDFQDPAAAAEALETWDGVGDPTGWYRHRPSNRRRPDGDATREYIAP